MSVENLSQNQNKAKSTIIVDRRLWGKIKEIATIAKMDVTSDIPELMLRILVAIVEHGSIPDDLGEVLARRDPEALEQLSKLVKRMKR